MRLLIYLTLLIASTARADVDALKTIRNYDMDRLIRDGGAFFADSLAAAELKAELAKSRDLREKLKAFNASANPRLTLQFTSHTEELMAGIGEARDSVLALRFGFLRRSYTEVNILIDQKAAAEKYGDPDKIAELSSRLEAEIKAVEDESAAISSYVAKEKIRLASLKRSEEAVAYVYNNQQKDLELAERVISRLAPLLNRDLINTDSGRNGERILNKIDLFGYRAASAD